MQTNIQKPNTAVTNVQESSVGVISVRKIGRADVFNLEVDGTHNFVIQGGVVAHNCADSSRYMCMANPIAPVHVEERKPQVFDPLSSDDGIRRDQYAFFRQY